MKFWPFGKKQQQPEPAKKSVRSYGGALFGRLVNDWVAQSTAADSEIRTSLRALRNRSRQLVRDNDFARNAIRAVQNNVVGKGIKLQAQVKMQRGNGFNERLNDRIESLWDDWCRMNNCHTGGTLSFQDIERLLISSVAESGEVLVRLVYQPFGTSPVPLALEIIESDQLMDERNGHSDNGEEIRMGVQRDSWGRPSAYWFFPHHPGDYQFQAVQPSKYKVVPAKEIIHLYRCERPGQTRGVPWFHAGIKRLHHLAGYEEAEVIAARASAAIMGFIETPEGDLEPDGTQDGQRVSNFDPGKIEVLSPGEKFTLAAPNRPAGQYEPFTRAMLRAFAAGIGVSYETVSKDYSQSNYSSSRLALLDDRDNWSVLQAWMIENFHQRVFEAWLDAAVMSGTLDLPGYELQPQLYTNVKWSPRGWAWVDPLKEVQAYKEAVRSGFMTQGDVIALNGGDFDELLEARAKETEAAEVAGVVFDSDPSQVDFKGDVQKVLPADAATEESKPGDAAQDEADGVEGETPVASSEDDRKKKPVRKRNAAAQPPLF